MLWNNVYYGKNIGEHITCISVSMPWNPPVLYDMFKRFYVSKESTVYSILQVYKFTYCFAAMMHKNDQAQVPHP